MKLRCFKCFVRRMNVFDYEERWDTWEGERSRETIEGQSVWKRVTKNRVEIIAARGASDGPET